MKRIIAILSAIIVVLFCLCACGKVNGSETTTDTGHVHTYGEWQTIKEADCVNVGERERTCSCGETETEEISALGHTGGTADCKTLAKCERCGEEYGDYGPHTGGTAYCTRRAVCSLCKKEYGELNADNHVSVKAATCTKKAQCTYCKKEIGDSVDPSNHLEWEGEGIDKHCKECHKSIMPETDSSIVDSTNEKPIDFNEYLKKVTDERIGRLSIPYSGQVKSYVRSEKNKLLTAAEKKKYVNTDSNATMPSRYEKMLTKEQALEDAKIAFKAFYTYYAPYEFLGEEKFDDAEKEVIKKINEYFAEDDMPMLSRDLYDIILSSLDFITDTHNGIYSSAKSGNFTYRNNKFYYAYHLSGTVFREDDAGYYTLANGNKWYLKDVNGGDFSEYLKVTIDESGELVYALVRIANPSAEKLTGDTVTVKRGDTEYTHDIVWKKYTKMYDSGQSSSAEETIWGTRVEDGVPIIHVRSFSRIYDAELTKYSESGSQFKNQKLFIVDLRHNGGGYSNYNTNWVKNYIANVQWSAIYGRVNYSSAVTKLPLQELMFKTTNDNNRKIVLIDNDGASSGELACVEFQSITNTLIIGTNTKGCCFSGDWVYVQLPNSTIVLKLGTNYFDFFNYYYKGMNPEGIGLMPDVFVNSTEALDLSMKMIEYYGIEKSKDTSGITTFGTGKR